MLYRKILIVMFLALILGCIEEAKDKAQRNINETQRNTINKEQEKGYKQQLLSYNAQISDRMERVKVLFEGVNKSGENQTNIGEIHNEVSQAINAHSKEFNEQLLIIKELVNKRNELKIKVIEQFGSLPEWWVETKSLTEK